ncbi:AMP-binding protein [bacterium]|nr:AMP-binding protein [bacterium]
MGARRGAAGPLQDSPFPLMPDWDAADSPWHAAYPEHVPPRVEFPVVRVERLLEAATVRYPDRIALHYFRTSWTYLELYDRVRMVAGSLKKLGIGTGDRVLLALPNQPEFVVAWFALHTIGAEPVPANPLMSGSELAALARKCGVKAALGLDVRMKPVAEMAAMIDLPLLVETSLATHLPMHLRVPYLLQRTLAGTARASDVTRKLPFDSLYRIGRPLVSPAIDDVHCPAVLQPTGGTTGTPKVAVLTHRNLCANVAQLHAWCQMEPGRETFLSVLPFFHVYGATCAMLSPLAGGSTLVLQARFDAARTLRLMQQHRPGVALLVPFMIASLNDEMRKRGVRLDGLRLCMSGASALSHDVAAEFEELTGARILEGFGLSEASPVTHSNPSDGTARVGTIGLPLPGTNVRLVDLETGTTEVPPGEVGELTIRGPQIMQGYLDAPDETAIALRDGWLHTGDLARMSGDGFFEIVDRKKDMIITGGLNVYPSEVEEVLAGHPSVLRCAVVGVEDRHYGEKVCAWVVPAKGCRVDFDVLRNFCRAQMSGYKVPREFHECRELPESFLGKVRRVELRQKSA